MIGLRCWLGLHAWAYAEDQPIGTFYMVMKCGRCGGTLTMDLHTGLLTMQDKVTP